MYTGDLVSALPLPDERPVTSVAVVESVTGCPPGFTVVAKTYDQDTDADLWKDGFWRRETRYLCLSKTEGNSGHVVEEVAIVGERDMPPESHTPIPYTTDTGSRAWKKKQIVYKVSPAETAIRFVVDVIVLSRQRSNPDGFSLLGELNGLTVCCKYGTKARTPRRSAPAPPLPYTPSPGSSSNGLATPSGTDTLTQAHGGIEGVPFVINPKLSKSKELKHFTLNTSLMTLEELENLTNYDFKTEYAALQ
ncbi:multivesicular body subunit 12B-like [Amphibalanus amphitrite]|uniref:multivesicular body subunit 12B-like n=1 Tax=Amphibalanus amphitrite TaxID=1232801 RepID=UPI001C903977|nr:multivesicular body subunit 12B-like [Amphibalanus amphitrite]XP_043213251.1 multivesicular body subunit 12B-like [Amphibalanus amphitrite]XP_043213252.1 multivesicular body subunit 12B-like [Amphibalanus amphitrite]XP_043213253.1 multivesicular body subunit 12B-like [Amphibalanus amphitrite]XP_043213254.1 multivesicular body subunit 12B-like [Amphibalanus amphitrite]XP_043213255.1 multivesicular body subunit 12B-like [Amphibalanus amphitrite]XP_043213256.1 multivesicular body subunit 12B-